jgi:hypothetical protein
MGKNGLSNYHSKFSQKQDILLGPVCPYAPKHLLILSQ